LARRSRCDNRRLRVLHAIHDFLPRHQAGSEIYAFELCRALSSRHDVTVLCAEYDPARPHGQVDWRVHERLPVVEIVNNWRCRSFADTYRPPLVADRIRRVLRAVRPHVVHVHSLLNLSFDLPALARAQGAAVVATLHDYTLVCASGGQRLHRADDHLCETIDTSRCVRCFRESVFFAQIAFGRIAPAQAPGAFRVLASAARRFPALSSQILRKLPNVPLLQVAPHGVEDRIAAAREAFDNIDVVVAPSSSVARGFRQLGFDDSRVHVSDYGFAPLPAAKTERRDGVLRIGFIGTLVWHKGVHVLIDAVRGLDPETYHLAIFGDPNTFSDYAAELRARANGLPVAFMGPFSHRRSADAYSQIDVLVVPSLWMENSPLVIHEAFMAGVPVVAARIGGIPDLVADGINGLLYDPRSPDELRTILRNLIDAPDRLTALAGARPPVKSVADDAREWEAIYARAVEARRPGGNAA
jgi:glycosyltransferase involved in cell wall biosynthesis